jgi:hypothetical protein
MGAIGDTGPKLEDAVAPLERLGDLKFDAESIWNLALASGASADALGELAVNLGIANDREIMLAQKQQALIEAFGRGEISASELSNSMAELGRQAAAADAQLRGVKQALDAIPSEKRVTVAVVHETRGSSGGTTETGQTGEFRQHGGPVKKGMPYIVGEKRPELFIPDQSGTIMPSVPRATGGDGAALGRSNVIINVNGDMMLDNDRRVNEWADKVARRVQQRGGYRSSHRRA